MSSPINYPAYEALHIVGLEKFVKSMPPSLSELKFVSYDLYSFVFKNLRRFFDKYSVGHTEHDTVVKSTTKILWPSQ